MAPTRAEQAVRPSSLSMVRPANASPASVSGTPSGGVRAEAAKNPYDRELSNLIGELSTRRNAFRAGGARDVHVCTEGAKRSRHPPLATWWRCA